MPSIRRDDPDSDARPAGDSPLPIHTKLVYALGDNTVNLVLSSASLLYLFFLTNIAGLRPGLAAAVIWIARAVDAFSDPTMGRISDLTRWRSGRRRPYFLIGALPFGACFALMWLSPGLDSQAAKFAYYATVYVGVSLAMTCLSVPYLALIPEMATDYHERTSFNTFRAAAAVLGTLFAVAMKPLSDTLGGDAAAWWWTGAIVGVWLVLPWAAVHAVSFERPGFQRNSRIGFVEGARILARHRAYRSLSGFYILARIAVDLIAVMFLYYFAVWLGREEDFAGTLVLFLAIVVLCLPFWLRVARHTDKKNIFIFGAAWWIGAELLIFLGQPEWPRWTIYAIASLAAVGYAVADLMPWSMLGDVVDEDELATGERREGIYVGFFTFIRKLGGATAVLFVGLALELSGYSGGLPRAEQPEIALITIRVLMALVPSLLLALAIWVAASYPMSRAAHRRVLAELRLRREST